MALNTMFNEDLRYFESIRKQRLTQQKEKDKVHAARDKYLGNRKSLSRDVAYMTGQLLPEKAVVKKSAYGGVGLHAHSL